MGFRFVHTADWQLGKQFSRFGSEKGAQLRDARVRVINRLAALAREEGARHVLVAGDVWDVETPPDSLLRQPVDRMAEASDVTWWLLPGNHDPARQESLWDRLRRRTLPPNLHLLTEPRPVLIERDLTVLPAPWTVKKPGRDLTAWFDGAERATQTVIGLAHGAVHGFGGGASEDTLIDPNRSEKAGLRYLALGDWHGQRPAGPRAHYSGTPEPDDFRKTKQGYALIVDLDDPEHPVPHEVGAYDWQWKQVELSAGETPQSRLDTLFPKDRSLADAVVKLTFEGQISFRDRSEVETRLREEEGRLFHLRQDWRRVSVLTDTRDLDERLGEGVLRRVADRLLREEDKARSGDAAAALRELDLLLQR